MSNGFDESMNQPHCEGAGPRRRGFFSYCLMWLGLGSAYGTFAALAARYLYPAGPDATGWLFAARLASLGVGEGLTYVSPAGDNVLITRQGPGDSPADFVALSSTCPHLGCRVHWEATNGRFFCPCHNGAFDRGGTATEGPPAAEGKNLPRYALRVENGLLFINVPLQGLSLGDRTA